MRRAVRNPVLLVIAGLMLLQAAWILTIPPFRGSDEFDHAYRAAAVAGGEWVAGAPVGDDGWLVEVPGSLVEAAHAQCEELPGPGPARCSAVTQATDGSVLVASTAASYHPVFYWVVGSAAQPFTGAGALYAMRIAASLLCLAFIAAAAWAVGRLPGRWPLAALVMASTPVLVYSTTIVAPNGLEMAAGLSLWSSLLAFCQERDDRQQRRLLWVAIVSAVVLGTLRLIGPLFILLILGTVAALRWRDLFADLRRHLRTFLVGIALVGASVAQFAWWTFGPPVLDSSGNSPDGSERFLMTNLVVWPMQTIAAFPYRNQMGAAIVYPVIGALVLALLIFAVRLASPRDTRVLLGSLAAALVLPILLTLATMDGRGVIWQGRYGLPYAVGFVLLAGLLAGQNSVGHLPWKVTAPALTIYGVAIAACLLKVRGDELADNPASRADAAWHAPWPILIVTLTASAMVAFLAAVSRRSDEPA